MNGEKLHDAIGGIDADLIAAVGDLRERGSAGRKIPWMRYASLAACVCILAGGILVFERIYHSMSGRAETETMAGTTAEGAPEAGMEEAVNDAEGLQETMVVPETESIPEGAPLYSGTILQEYVPENVQYIRTNGYVEWADYPMVYIFSTPETLTEYYEGFRDLYDLAPRETVYADSTIGFADAIKPYDADWFTEHDLVMVVLEEGSGSIRHEVSAITETPEKWIIDITAIEPETCTDDMAQWHILMEVEKNLIDVSAPIPVVVE